MDTATFKTSENFYKNNFSYGMIFTNDDASTSNYQVEKLTRELNIYYRSCIGSLIYFLSKIVDLSFTVQKLAKFHQILLKYILRDWYIVLDKLGKIRLWV